MIKFVGDINLTDWDFNFGFGIGSRISEGFNPFHGLQRNQTDVWVGNFEGVASDVTDRSGMASKVFRVSPSVLEGLRHFDAYGFANNHAMQHGVAAYGQTVAALEKYGSRVFGSKENKSILLEHQGKKISLTGACFRVDEFTEKPCYWYNPEYESIKEEIDALPSDAFKVFFVHWGNEYINRPSSQQKKFARWLIDAGFDLIIGMHPHVLQGYEDYQGRRIYYSLGNFVFDMVWEPCRYGAFVSLDFSEGYPVYRNEYVFINKDCSPVIVTENEVPERYQFEYLNEQLKKEDNSEAYHNEIGRLYKSYSKANRNNILKNILAHPSFGVEVLKDFIKRRL
mgnify:CR=1 FL=1